MAKGSTSKKDQSTVTLDPLEMRVFVYVGPTVPGLTSRTILGRELPGYVNDMAAACAALKRFIVPLSLMADTLKAINRRGSSANSAAMEVINHFNRR